MKQAFFLVTDHGMEGKGPERIIFASQHESVRDNWYEESKNKNFYSKADRVLDLHEVAKSAWNKLDGMEKLAFLDTSCPMWNANYPVFGKNWTASRAMADETP